MKLMHSLSVGILASLLLLGCAGSGSFKSQSVNKAVPLDKVRTYKIVTIDPSGAVDEELDDKIVDAYIAQLNESLEKKGLTYSEDSAEAVVFGEVTYVKLGSSGGRVAAELFLGALGRYLARAEIKIQMSVKSPDGTELLTGESFGTHEVGGRGVETEILEATKRAAKAFVAKIGKAEGTQAVSDYQ